MEKCINHEDRLTGYSCLKHGLYMCKECTHCKDPTIYCKFRQSCPIWYAEKHGKSEDETTVSSPELPE